MNQPPDRPKFSTNTEPSKPLSKESFPYKRKRHLLSDGEKRFYHDGLMPAIGDRYGIHCKVRLTDIVTVSAKQWRSAAGRKIQQRHVDFLLVQKKSLAIVAAIELDDATHLDDEKKIKDVHLGDVLFAAGVPLLRFPVYRDYDPKKIRGVITRVLKTHPLRSCQS